MCGIAGVIHLDRSPVDPAVVARMTASLIHRGPDGGGVHRPVPWVGLGHRRLSIIDLEGGQQPLANEDERVWVTYNGEVFNYRELREELLAKGHAFRTRTDSEVLVHLYEEEGSACVERLNGQFAFALWDGERLLLARDPLGIKPLYYYRDGDVLAFASEPRAFFALPGFPRAPSLEGLRLYFRYRFIPAPASAFRGVAKLRPAESITVHADGRLEARRYWDLDAHRVEDMTDVDEAGAELAEVLDRAVAGQTVADVPVGAFLSGGLDSASVTSILCRHASESPRAFGMGFPTPAFSEVPFAREAADRCGAHFEARTLDAERARALIPRVLDGLDEPFGDASLLPTYALSAFARERVKVCLSGDGGDELFAGYGRYFRALHVLGVPPALRPIFGLLRRLAAAPTDPARWRWGDTPRVDAVHHASLTRTTTRERRRLLGPALRDTEPEAADPIREVFDRLGGLPPLARLLAVDLHSLLSEYHLVKVDRASMLTSLEVRVPLLDKRFVELAFRFAPAVRLFGQQSKGLLRRAMEGRLPHDVLHRHKHGFGPPFEHWFAGDLADVARERLADSLAVREGLLDRRGVDALLRPGSRGKVKGSRIWRLLVLEAWLRGVREGRFDPPADTAEAPVGLHRGASGGDRAGADGS